jgi:hypothetical protein
MIASTASTASNEIPSIKYRVSIKNLAARPMVGSDGHLTQAVAFHVEPLGSDNSSPFDIDCGCVGGETLYRTELLQEKGHLIVELPGSWLAHRSAQWQQDVVNLALQQAASEGA